MENTFLRSKKRVQAIVTLLSAIHKETSIQSVAVLPDTEEAKVVLFTEDAKVKLSPEAAMRLGKHLIHMSQIAQGVKPDLEEQEEKGIWTL
jgi:hypothetical protein